MEPASTVLVSIFDLCGRIFDVLLYVCCSLEIRGGGEERGGEGRRGEERGGEGRRGEGRGGREERKGRRGEGRGKVQS